MKTILLSIMLFVIIIPCISQDNKDTLASQVLEFPEIEAEFPGGTVELMDYLIHNINYPMCQELDSQGKIYLSFIVNTDGSVSDVKVERGINHETDDMAKKLILDMPHWKPAVHRGELVRSRVRLPIIIHLE